MTVCDLKLAPIRQVLRCLDLVVILTSSMRRQAKDLGAIYKNAVSGAGALRRFLHCQGAALVVSE
ncbi:hypothetical protein KGM_201204 [Danaus plexippus plexippus]|uniref:Uncharacterized protein n=1 Tax=Danaus plexippus plexippus TaxID=278856 RepID=A0A212FBG4_DANPL|nr:hypothetical protein KGM_201204 [Danaus plexippus plexippus]